MENSKVLVIGIDGGTFDVISPLVAEGKLPNMASIMQSGAKGELISTIVPITPPAWASFMTGKNPGKHGLFGFETDSHSSYYERTSTNRTHIKALTLWPLLSEYQKRLILVNIPFTYPPQEINGLMISGMMTPSEQHTFTYPAELYQEIVQQVGDYKINFNFRAIKAKYPSLEFYDETIRKAHYITEKRGKAALYLLNKYEWDFFMVVFTITDKMQHRFWKFMDTGHPEYDSKLAERYGNVIFEAYQKVDSIIGEMMQAADEETTIIVLSDHGFGPLNKIFCTNNWLLQKGLLRLKKQPFWDLQMAYPTINRCLIKLGLQGLAKRLPPWLGDAHLPIVKRRVRGLTELIDWNRTKAYGTTAGININLRTREPEGIVEPSKEYDDLLDYITDELYQLTDPESGEKVVDAVWRKEEIYQGEYTDEATDVIFPMKGLSYISQVDEEIRSDKLFASPSYRSTPHAGRKLSWCGFHRMEGILMIQGPAIKENVTLEAPEIIDLAPTILYLLGLPVPDDMDGRIPTEAIDPSFLQEHPPVAIKIGAGEIPAQGAETAYLPQDAKRVEDLLRGLGYLG